MVAAETASHQVEAQSRFRDIAEAYDVTSSLDRIERRCRLMNRRGEAAIAIYSPLVHSLVSKLGSKSKIKGLPEV